MISLSACFQTVEGHLVHRTVRKELGTRTLHASMENNELGAYIRSSPIDRVNNTYLHRSISTQKPVVDTAGPAGAWHLIN
jgi:hypothetical protein